MEEEEVTGASTLFALPARGGDLANMTKTSLDYTKKSTKIYKEKLFLVVDLSGGFYYQRNQIVVNRRSQKP